MTGTHVIPESLCTVRALTTPCPLDQDVDALERWTTRSVSDGSVTARRYIWHTMVACRSLKWRKAIRSKRERHRGAYAQGVSMPTDDGSAVSVSLPGSSAIMPISRPASISAGESSDAYILTKSDGSASVYACMHCIGPVTRRALFVPCYVSLV